MVQIEGTGLHTGAPVRVALSASPGPVRLRSGGLDVPISRLSVASSLRSTTVQACDGSLSVGMVEHVFGALAGLGIRGDVVIDVDGPEMPLLDGGAAVWCEALSSLGISRSAPRLRVTRHAIVEVGRSLYDFVPGPSIDVEVVIELENTRVSPSARWTGDADDFVRRIAPSRTFAQTCDLDELVRRDLSRHVTPDAVVLITPEEVHSFGRPFSLGEPACHKLLDLLGDCYLYGGPPLGRLRATRPGHRANARAFAQALEQGILRPEGEPRVS
jgi:UDP-3-O-[3-hydroxymyristoyl] N-acetylglucosamine deacetylase